MIDRTLHLKIMIDRQKYYMRNAIKSFKMAEEAKDEVFMAIFKKLVAYQCAELSVMLDRYDASQKGELRD